MSRHERVHASRRMVLTPELVALCHREVPRLPDDPDQVTFGEDDYERAAREVLASLGGDPIWVFAYGSLLWKPVAAPVEQRLCTAEGWHRSFCIEMRRWRGTPEEPGLMMGLRRGGICAGIAQRFQGEDRHRLMINLLKREVGGPVRLSSLRQITLASNRGLIRALCFYAEPDEAAATPERSEQEVAEILSRACGPAGSGAEYLFKTVSALQAHGICDPHLWRLQELVAAAISMKAATQCR